MFSLLFYSLFSLYILFSYFIHYFLAFLFFIPLYHCFYSSMCIIYSFVIFSTVVNHTLLNFIKVKILKILWIFAVWNSLKYVNFIDIHCNTCSSKDSKTFKIEGVIDLNNMSIFFSIYPILLTKCNYSVKKSFPFYFSINGISN